MIGCDGNAETEEDGVASEALLTSCGLALSLSSLLLPAVTDRLQAPVTCEIQWIQDCVFENFDLTRVCRGLVPGCEEACCGCKHLFNRRCYKLKKNVLQKDIVILGQGV